MKRVISVIVGIALLCLACSLAEGSTFEFSNMTDEELVALIEAAQAELDSRSAADESQGGDSEPASTVGTLYVSEARLVVQSDQYKSLYPDLLQAILVNDTEDDIRDAVVDFMAWDVNGLPVLIKGQFDFNAARYVMRGNYNGINMIPGSTYGENSGLKLDDGINGIAAVKAIVVSYETFDGKTWTNPEYDSYIEQYAGKKLAASD